MAESEYRELYNRVKDQYMPFTFVVYEIQNWNNSLSPWPCQIQKGKMEFGGLAQVLLRDLEEKLIPSLDMESGSASISLMGYSLAGLFALWAVGSSSLFSGAISCSGSLWYPGFLDWMEKVHFQRAVRIYLSLGDREENTKHPVMRTVGDETRKLAAMLEADCLVENSVLEWNPGGHFVDAKERLLRGIGWYFT